MTEHIKSDVPLGLPREASPESEAWLKRVKAEILGVDDSQIANLISLSENPCLQQIWLDDIETFVKYDKPVKLSVFYTSLSAYLRPMNLSIKGDTGVGKTHNTISAVSYFPVKDVWMVGGLSPKALIHEHGHLFSAEGKCIDDLAPPEKPQSRDYEREEFKEAKEAYHAKFKEYMDTIHGSYTLIDLSGIIMVFLEPPSIETWEMLRPILSHDVTEIEYRFVDKSAKGSLRTTKVKVRGWPSAIFLEVDRRFMSEFATRVFTVTPSSQTEKIGAANELINRQDSFPWEYETDTLEKTLIKALIFNIKRYVQEEHIKTVNPFPNMFTAFPKEIVRDMRDFQHFNQFLSAVTLLHLYQRPIIEMNGKKYVISTLNDVLEAAKIFRELFETTRTNTDERVLDFYHNIVESKTEGITLDILVNAYNLTAKKKLSDYAIRNWLNRLNEINYVDILEGVKPDKRKKRYVPLIKKSLDNLLETNGFPSNQTDLALKLKEGFETWFKTIGKPNDTYTINIFEVKTTIPLNELKNHVINNSEVFQHIDKPIEEPETEKEQEDNGKSENQPVSSNSGEVGINGYNQRQGVAIVSHVKTSEQCYNGCPLLAEWQISIGDDCKQLFCNTCFNKAKKDLESNGYRIEFSEEPKHD
jgi:hypothetical protein